MPSQPEVARLEEMRRHAKLLRLAAQKASQNAQRLYGEAERKEAEMRRYERTLAADRSDTT